MRGNIIMWNGEKGIVTASGQRYDFDIHTWKGDVAPKTDMSVILTLNEGALLDLSPLADADIAKEKLSQISGAGSNIAKGILTNVGIDVATAYGLFALSALFFKMISGKGYLSDQSATMAAVLNGMPYHSAGFSGGGFGIILVLIAIMTIAIPYFWKDKIAPLALCVPLLITLIADYQAWHISSTLKHLMGGFSGFAPFSLGFGVYLSTAIAAYLAFRGYKKFKNQSA